MRQGPIRVLTFSSLFPNPAQPLHGLFVAERLRHLLHSGKIKAQIVAPVPWFPSRSALFGRYASFAFVPKLSWWEGIEILHPRHLVVPGPGWYATPYTMAAGVWRAIQRMRVERGDFDLIDAHYLYPDGVAASLVGAWLNKPVVLTARGSDVTLIPKYSIARRLILAAIRRSSGLIAVSQTLKQQMIAFGITADAVTVLRNGVDTTRFRPLDREACRRRFGVEGRVALSVGSLIVRKGHDLVIDAVARNKDWTLLIVGDGPLKTALRDRADEAGCGDRVQLLGALPQNVLVEVYNAADVLVLASSREGMANVLLEAMACGTPIIATEASGAKEVLDAPRAGRVVETRTAATICRTLSEIALNPPKRAHVREHAERLGWEPTTVGQISLFERILGP